MQIYQPHINGHRLHGNHKQHAAAQAATAPALADPAATTTTSAPSSTATAPATTLNQLAAAYRTRFSSQQSIDLTVKTAEGDTIHIQLALQGQQALSAAYQSDANGQQLALTSSQTSSAGLSISIDGNLNADEKKALGDLVNQVGTLANSFFNGDASGTLQQAQALDLSNPALSSFALNLHSDVSASTQIATYQSVQALAGDASGSGTATPSTSTSTAVNLVDALHALLPQAGVAANPAGLLKQLLAAHLGAGAQQNNPLLDFANRLLDVFGAGDSTSTAATPSTSADTATTPTATAAATADPTAAAA